MKDKKTADHDFLRGLVAAFPLSIISLFFLDGSLSFIFSEYWLVPSTKVLAWIVIFTILRAVFAEWVVSTVVGFSPPQRSSKRILGIFVALVLYGIPMMTVCMPVRSPLSLIVLPLLKLISDVLYIVYMPRLEATVVVLIYLPLLLDFSRLVPYLYIKRWIRSRTGVDMEITPIPPKKVLLTYVLAIIALYLLNMFVVFPSVGRGLSPFSFLLR